MSTRCVGVAVACVRVSKARVRWCGVCGGSAWCAARCGVRACACSVCAGVWCAVCARCVRSACAAAAAVAQKAVCGAGAGGVIPTWKNGAVQPMPKPEPTTGSE